MHFPKGYIGWEWDDDDDDFLHRHDADRRDFGTDAVESYSGVREVELEMAVGNVTVERHDGDTIEVETVGVAEELKFHSYMEENTLKLEAKKRVTGIEGAEDGTVSVSYTHLSYSYFTAQKDILHKIRTFYCEKFLFLNAEFNKIRENLL